VTALDVYCATTLTGESRTPLPPPRDYTRRSGFPRAAAQMRGAAANFEAPSDFRTPEPLRPWTAA
jgi:hypothetical protein